MVRGTQQEATYRLHVLSGPAEGTVLVLAPGDRLVLGRSAKADLRCADDPFLSGQHAELRHDGGPHAVDLFSTNGTRLNGERLPPGVPRLLAVGDLVEVGQTRLRVHSAAVN